MKETVLRKLIYGYLIIPVLIFLAGWLKFFIALPIIIGLIIAMRKILKTMENNNYCFSWSTVIFAFLIAMIWCILAGQGGYYYQSDDYNARNAIFRDLVLRKWPVIYPEENIGLVYYVGHWMVPALFGKMALLVFDETIAWNFANFILLLWSTVGITAVFLLLFRVVGATSRKARWISVICMIFFSGLDIIGIAMQCVTNRKLILIDHIECWSTIAEYSSLTTCLFWVFNQTIVPWIVTLLYLNGENKRNFAFWGITCTLYGPLPALGLLPFMVGSTIGDLFHCKSKEEKLFFLKEVFSMQNVISTVLLFPVIFIYYHGNYAWSESAINYMNHSPWGLLKTLLVFLLFIILEFGIYAVLLFPDYYKEWNYRITVITLLFVLLFQVGMGNDFSMRVSIPGLFVLMTMVTKKMLQLKEHYLKDRISKWCACLLVVAFIIGMVTPLIEYGRGVYQIFKENKIDLVKDDMKTLEGKEQIYTKNFVTFELNQDIFFNYLGR